MRNILEFISDQRARNWDFKSATIHSVPVHSVPAKSVAKLGVLVHSVPAKSFGKSSVKYYGSTSDAAWRGAPDYSV